MCTYYVYNYNIIVVIVFAVRNAQHLCGSLLIVPGSVINVEVANLSSSKLRVNWTAPESGGPVHSYRVTVSTAMEDNIIMTDNVFINIINLSKSMMIIYNPSQSHSTVVLCI